MTAVGSAANWVSIVSVITSALRCSLYIWSSCGRPSISCWLYSVLIRLLHRYRSNTRARLSRRRASSLLVRQLLGRRVVHLGRGETPLGVLLA